MISIEVTQDLGALAKALGHEFKNPALLADAVTHPSLAGLRSASKAQEMVSAYERLEFLGDRVLGLVIAEWLLERFPDEREGDIAKRHVGLVRREALEQVAEAIDLPRYLRLVAGSEGIGGRANRTVLSDSCEALIGALYLDGGLAPAQQFIRRMWAPMIAHAVKPPQDPKTRLQEWLLARAKPLPVYETVGQSGPPHAPVFEVRVQMKDGPSVTGRGASKREAEKQAAEALLNQLEGQA